MHFFIDYILSFLALIVVLVFIHELGHFLFARLFKVKVESFSIGFGKELFGFYDKKGTRWKISLIPLGGYVKMQGEMLPSNKASDNKKDSFHNKTLWQKALIVLAGPAFNLILPIITFIFLTYFAGVSEIKPEVSKVVNSSVAFKYLKAGDLILKINNNKIHTFTEMSNIIKQKPGKLIKLTVLRHGKTKVFNLRLDQKIVNNVKVGSLGIYANTNASFSKKYGFLKSVSLSFVVYKNVSLQILNGFKQLFMGKVKLNDLGGPVKIAQLSGQMANKGFTSWVFFLSVLSINLAIVNLVPIPALDGGYLFLYLVQAVIRRPLNAKLQNILVIGGFAFLIIMVLLVTFHDILRLFSRL